MSLPPELRSLCFQLSTIAPAQLPIILPSLQHDLLRCRVPLTSPSGPTGKDAPETAVLVHKLKTQLTTLLQGKSAEGRFAAAVLIKGAIDVGGWEVLRGAEPWVRGLMAILNKADSTASKQICVLALTNIYLETHQYQTLIREITTPTLPTYVTSCLKLITSKASGRPLAIPQALLESILNSFSTLIPRHPTVFRPLATQIRTSIKPYLTPTRSDGRFVPTVVQKSAQRVAVVLNLTAPKNNGGEDWTKAVNSLIKEVHQTSDQVFRAVVEDWEPAANYHPQSVDINQPLQGGKSDSDLPQWSGLESGIERLVGLLRFLGAHFKYQTATAVNIGLGAIMDVVSRILSVEPTSGTDSTSSTRLRGGIEKRERESLWAGLPSIHTAATKLLIVLVKRLEAAFIPQVQQSLELVFWLFSSQSSTSSHDEDFRTAAYQLIVELLRVNGPILSRSTTRQFIPVIQVACNDLNPGSPSTDESRPVAAQAQAGNQKNGSNGTMANADSFLKTPTGKTATQKQPSELLDAASELLPFCLSHLAQQHLEISTRSLIDRTAILTHNKDAMVASILHPFIGRNKRALASILPHAMRAFPNDPTIESILRPRFPPLPLPSQDDDVIAEDEDEDEDDVMTTVRESKKSETFENDSTFTAVPIAFAEPATTLTTTSSWSLSGASTDDKTTETRSIFASRVDEGGRSKVVDEEVNVLEVSKPAPVDEESAMEPPITTSGVQVSNDDSDDESVHLNMELSDSDEDEAMDD